MPHDGTLPLPHGTTIPKIRTLEEANTLLAEMEDIDRRILNRERIAAEQTATERALMEQLSKQFNELMEKTRPVLEAAKEDIEPLLQELRAKAEGFRRFTKKYPKKLPRRSRTKTRVFRTGASYLATTLQPTAYIKNDNMERYAAEVQEQGWDSDFLVVSYAANKTALKKPENKDRVEQLSTVEIIRHCKITLTLPSGTTAIGKDDKRGVFHWEIKPPEPKS